MNIAELSPPHSTEAEQGILGGLMLDNDAWDLIADVVTAEDFFRREHKLIFQAIEGLAKLGSPFDVVTLSSSMSEIDQSGGLPYLSELAKNTPSVANIKAYAEIVRNRAHLRRLIQFGYQCTREASEERVDAAHVQDAVEQHLFSIGQNHQKSDFININTVLSQVVDEIDTRFNKGETVVGLATGIKDLDEFTGGLTDSELIIVAARPSMGKTSLALNFVDAALEKNPESSVQIYSIEMPARLLLYRLIAVLGRIDVKNLMTGALKDEDWPKLTYAISRINSYGERLVIDDSSDQTPSGIRARSRRASRRFGKPCLIMVDYLQMMKCPGKENRNNEIAEISNGLKALAKEMVCPVVALSQLNRSLEQRQNKRPVNADLRESGSLEQDADVIMFVYRDEVYHPETEHKGIAELIIGKNRNGPTGTVRTAFIANQTRFENLAASTWQGAPA
ncbi:replicative DNA helicase [Pseudomonas cichorii]|uniref:replicative DNA helicase n=1 Tax=Pseudomonas cichorii TaxID=36746 RepID=UPI0018E5B067|nr:replicative DNA helicase [Pseudomonas cichorii]MBI6854658.1 replicative DNA helicase [Pseudomonas cichorii]